jgi:cell division septal protein FtsQ
MVNRFISTRWERCEKNMKTFIKEYFWILFFATVLVFIILGTVIVYNIFTVKNVIVESNFNVDENDIVRYLDIEVEENRLIWSYDTNLLEKKLFELDYFYKYSIVKKYPDTIIIEINVRVPIATIIDGEGVVSFIDTNNVIFKMYSVDTLLPLIVYNGDSLFENKFIENEFTSNTKEINVTNDLLKNIVRILSNLNISNRKVFDNISQIEISEKRNELIYSISFRNRENNIYFKDYIKYNLIIDSFISLLFLSESGINNNIYYTGNGFVY